MTKTQLYEKPLVLFFASLSPNKEKSQAKLRLQGQGQGINSEAVYACPLASGTACGNQQEAKENKEQGKRTELFAYGNQLCFPEPASPSGGREGVKSRLRWAVVAI
jgi:hypothetical protein